MTSHPTTEPVVPASGGPSAADPATAELLERLARIEAAHLELLAAHDELRASHAALRASHAELLTAPGSPPPPASLVGASGGEADEPAPAGGGTSRRMLIGGGLAGAAAVVTGALLGAEPAAATTGAMQFGANNNAGTSGTNLTSTAVDKTLFLENTGSGQGLRVQSSGPGAAVTAGGIALAVTSTGTIGVDVFGATTGVNAETTTGVGLRGTTGSGTAGTFSSSTGKGVSIRADHAQLELRPTTGTRVAPTADATAHVIGELIRDGAGDLWLCVATGVPGTWRKLGGTATAGALHVLGTPVRIYDSRAGTTPAVGLKKPFTGGEARTLDCTVNSSGVPADAIAVQVTCFVVNAAAGSANFTVWACGKSKPAANSLVWGGDSGRASTLAISALGTGAKIQVSPSVAADVAVDVVGFYR